jgi:hypothetical protein
VIELSNDIVYIINGKLAYTDGDFDVLIKNKYNFEEPLPAFYAVESL